MENSNQCPGSNQIPEEALVFAAQLGQTGVVHGLHEAGVLGQLQGAAAVEDLCHELGTEIFVFGVEGDAQLAQDQAQDVEAVQIRIPGELLGLPAGGLIDLVGDGKLVEGAGDALVLVVILIFNKTV